MKTKQHLFILVAVVSAFLWFFGAVLFQDRSFGFRDSANYYYPLFEWETREWAAGRIPLWNPLDDTGTPVLADTTSSVLYPGKPVLALPVSFRLRYHIYVTMHVLLAAAMVYALARRWHASIEGAGLASLAYAFGGSVVFQYCNVVFLIGAAWLPAALLATDWMLSKRSLIGAAALGAVLALMTLGGDPQASYHGGLLAAVYALFARRQDNETAPLAGWHQHPLALLAFAACSGFLLAAVQILPAMESAARSDRAAYEYPRTLYECTQWVNNILEQRRDEEPSEIGAQLIGNPEHGTHLRHVYHFSVGPWHATELLWPNCSGRLFPRNERWINALPAEGRTWTPSLYLGLLPLLLAALMLPSWRGDWRVRFLIVVAVLSLLGSFGWYGPGWITHELRAAFTAGDVGEPWIGNPVGGVYWLLVVLLPGYVMFRYPAKLLVVTSFAISLLAARGWDRFVRDEPSKLSRFATVVTGISLTVAAVFGLAQPAWRSWLASAPPDATFGPINVADATSSVLTALAHTAACGLLLVVVLMRASASSRSYLLVAMTTIELCLANAWMTTSIDAEVWRADVISMSGSEDMAPPPRFFRESSARLTPAAWAQRSDARRLDDLVSWERASLLPRHHLGSNVAIVGAHTTLRSLDTAALIRVRQRHAQLTRGERPDALLAPLSVSNLLVGAQHEPPGCEKMNISAAEGVELWGEPRAYPRAWLVSRVEIVEPLPVRSRRLAEAQTRAVFLDGALPRDLRDVVFIEAAANEQLPTDLPALSDEDHCRVVRYSAQQVDIEVRTTNEAWLVLNDTFYPGWQATRETNGQRVATDIYRANRLMRGVLLSPGEHLVEFVYGPRRFWLGVTISGLAWLVLIVALTLRGCQRARSDS